MKQIKLRLKRDLRYKDVLWLNEDKTVFVHKGAICTMLKMDGYGALVQFPKKYVSDCTMTQVWIAGKYLEVVA